MAKQNASNQDYTNEADGWNLGGGIIKRFLRIITGDITFSGGSGNTQTMPSSSQTLVGRTSVDVLENKDLTNPNNTLPATTPTAHASTHSDGGTDEVKLEDLGATSTDTAKFFQPDGAGGVQVATPPSGVTDHGALTGLADDDHTQYHTDARGDARYYTETELDAGQLDNRYFTEAEHLDTSAGAGDAGKPVKLDAGGNIDASMINSADVDHNATANFLAAEHVDWAASSAGTIDTSNYIEGGPGTDGTAIHDNVSAEISAIAEKTAPIAADLVLIEDSEASNTKKKIQLDKLTSVTKRSAQLVVANFNSALSTGDGKFFFHINSQVSGKNLVKIHGEVITAGTTGTTDIQIFNIDQAADMLSTKLTIDSGETGSDTAATPAVIDTANDDVVENDLLRIDVDATSTTKPKGLIITLEFE